MITSEICLALIPVGVSCDLDHEGIIYLVTKVEQRLLYKQVRGGLSH